MLPGKNRVDKSHIEQVFKKGKVLNSSGFTFRFLIQKPSFTRVSFIAPKSVAKLATKRNLLRRRGYNVLVKYIKEFPSDLVGVFVFKKPIDSLLEVENEIKIILNKL